MEKCKEVFARFKLAPNPTLMVASHDGVFYYVNQESRQVICEYDSKEPMLSRCIRNPGVQRGVVLSTPKITGLNEEEIRCQCQEILGEDPQITKFKRVYHIHPETGDSHQQDGDDLLLIHRTIWHIVAKGSIFQYSVLDVFYPCLERDASLSKRFKCPVFHARSAHELLDICQEFDIHLPGNGSLFSVIRNMSRRIVVDEKISNTSSFFWGSFNSHKVAVRKVSTQDYADYYWKTVGTYNACHDLDGIVRIEFEERYEGYYYIAFEACKGNLVDVCKYAKEFMKLERVNIMRDLIRAVMELIIDAHIIHANLNPWNVLIKASTRGSSVKLCGFRNSKQIDEAVWTSEVVNQNKGDTFMSMYNSEMRNLGDTLLHVMSDGEYKHEGADMDWTVARRKEIIDGVLAKLPVEFSAPINLLAYKTDKRFILPEQLLVMPCFWVAKKKMLMLRDTCDKLLDKNSEELESSNLKIFGKDWADKIDKDWFKSMKESKDGRHHNFNTKSMRSLLILLRNSINHPGETEPGTDPITLDAYLSKTWPALFMHIYKYAKKYCPRKSAMYKEYFTY